MNRKEIHAVAKANKALKFIGAEDPTTALTNMITNLRHWADYSGAKFYDAVNDSYDRYLQERSKNGSEN